MQGLAAWVLDLPEVTRYLAVRFDRPDSQAMRLAEWGRFIHRRTDGNPLFMVAMVDDLLRRGMIGEAALDTSWPAPPNGMAGGMPESLRQLIDHQLERLSEEEQQMLEAASVAGLEFSANWVATVIDTDVLEVEGRCEALARRHLFLCAPKDPGRPNRRLTERYRFLHTLSTNLVPRVAGGVAAATPPTGGGIEGDRLRQPQRGDRRRAGCAFRGGERRPPGGALSRGRRHRKRCGARPAGRPPTC